MANRKPKILFYDIETRPLKAWIWGLGEQVIRPHQLVEGDDQFGIICIAYAWETGPVHVIDWDYKKQDSGRVVREFDKIIRQADITIGKNSQRFDTKMINTQRLIHDLPPYPEWTDYTDDLEKQVRKYFRLPSYGLDYLSKEFGLGGKKKMAFEDWVQIVEKTNIKAFEKMKRYNKKDVSDTRYLWKKCAAHFKPRLNMATFMNDVCCASCGSKKIKKNGVRMRGKTRYQMYFCNAHGGYAGQRPISAVQKKEGKMGL